MRQAPHLRRLRGGRPNGRKQRNNVFESNGPDVKVRGNAGQVVERYLTLARDAMSAGDRIAAENYFQHADHYYRILSAEQANSGSGNGAAAQPQSQAPVEAVAEADTDESDDDTEPALKSSAN